MRKFYFSTITFFITAFAFSQIISFADPGFKQTLLLANSGNQIAQGNIPNVNVSIDTNNNGQIEISEAQQIRFLDVTSYGIYNLSGIEYFTNLTYLGVNYNYLTALDVSTLTNLQQLDCDYNQLTALNVNGLVNLKLLSTKYNNLTALNVNTLNSLEEIDCRYNYLSALNFDGKPLLKQINCSTNLTMSSLHINNCPQLYSVKSNHCSLTAIDIVNCPSITGLDFSENDLTSIDGTQFPGLVGLICNNNALTSLNVVNLPNLMSLECQYNQLTALDLTGSPKIYNLRCDANQITSLDVSHLPILQILHCNSESLVYLNMKNGNGPYYLNFHVGSYNSNLAYWCVNEAQEAQVLATIAFYGMTNCVVNTYCSFNPEGIYYDIAGTTTFDADSNGCSLSDGMIPSLKLHVDSGTVSGDVVADQTGNYTVHVSSGTHTVSPILENPSYFTVSPSSVSVTFPQQANPFTQSFCITANGVHNDAEITMIPVSVARPGFDATYKLIYHNKGNQVLSGSVQLVFQDSLLDFVTANPAVTNQSPNILSWDYVNLQPFESREIIVVLNVNTPTETPPVTMGTLLNFLATVTHTATDEIPADNTFEFKQVVVASMDPNDKTCLEGATVTSDMIGKYVHYLIRFENTGNYPAENVVVKDLIDATKFDVNSLVPLSGSHPYITRISNTNKIEFIFENINLPFDDAHNDGYVAFKIKTKPTLTVGDTFSNTASIYFDYNAPIVTNTATTTIQALANTDFDSAGYFTLAPNPVKDILTIHSSEATQISSLSIYNSLGQLVMTITQPENTIDVSALKTGSYFIKIISDKGSSGTKFLKK